MISAILFNVFVHAECPAGSRARPITGDAARIATDARRTVGEVCPDRHATGTEAEQSDLLEAVRARALPKLRARQAAERDGNASNLMTAFNDMRLHLAERQADVTFERGAWRLAPATHWAHAPGFAKLNPLTPAENERLQARYAERLAALNARAAAGSPKAVIARLGNELRDDIRRGGREGYARMIAAEPALLLVNGDRDVFVARAAYQKGVEEEVRALAKAPVRPPSAEALAMIYYGTTVTEVLRERPQLCGAFFALKSQADALRRIHDAAESAVDAGGTLANVGCATAGLVVPVIGSGCLGMGVLSFLDWTSWTKDLGGARFRERQMLYGN